MTLGESIEILKREKDVADLNIRNGIGSKRDEDVFEAVEVVMIWIDKMYCALVR